MNQLESLPETLALCPSLEGLSLLRNKIRDIPLWFYRLHKLAQLDLAENQLVKVRFLLLSPPPFSSLLQVSSVFGQLHSLKSLDLSNNRIASAPLPLGLLAESLEALNLSGNPLPEDIAALSAQVRFSSSSSSLLLPHSRCLPHTLLLLLSSCVF